MRTRDTFDVMTALMAMAGDAVAIFAGFQAAIWIRFHSGAIPLLHEEPSSRMYTYGALIATVIMLFIFRNLGLYKRPQLGAFIDKIPRLTRAVGWGILMAMMLGFMIRTELPFSRTTVAMSFVTVLAAVLLERMILFRLESRLVRLNKSVRQVLIIGTDHIALRLKSALEKEPHLRTEVLGFLRAPGADVHAAIPAALVRGEVDALDALLDAHPVHQVILADMNLRSTAMVGIILACEQRLVNFQLVPDLFRVLTSGVTVDNIDGIPVLGVSKWPLDIFWNRFRKRIEDILGACLGLIAASPIILVAAVLIKRQSPGPVFYKQERCGEGGRVFNLYKLRTMQVDAEEETGPVWAAPDDPRRTPIGAFLRRHNLDELPQFWNVLKGEMSLVGPRPERPHFVEQFKEDISRYMWRHRSKPGLTGWAQVNGLRGQSSLDERIRYDLFYLENWSIAFDLKILLRTLAARENAY